MPWRGSTATRTSSGCWPTRARPRPDPTRMRRFAHVMGDPQDTAPVIHLTGTNGKTSTARGLTTLLMAKGLTVGTFTSPASRAHQ